MNIWEPASGGTIAGSVLIYSTFGGGRDESRYGEITDSSRPRE